MGAVNLLFVGLTALAISMVATSALMHLAPHLRMVDMPDARKVHAHAIPRVGGLGIIGGALTAVLFWGPAQPWLASYVFGSVVLLVFGAADDSLGLGHYAKFVGQIAAAGAVVYVGDVWVAHVPFIHGELLPAIGKPFTLFALVGLINAINHSDGLDGLAGGEVLMSLGCIAYLAHAVDTSGLVVFVAAMAGGLFGFLRFNTHPARVFMGDAGSQFIGFSLGVLVVLLTQQVNPSLSMALPALIIGLPVIDILAVFGQRVLGGMNWFRATRNHIHHRLLDLGFQHHEVVIIIYSVQALLVCSALVLAYEADATIAATYLAVCGSLFAFISVAERRGWRWRRHGETESSGMVGGRWALRLHRVALRFVRLSVPAFLVASSIAATKVSPDFAFTAVAVLALALASLALRTARAADWLLRLALFCGAASVVYLGPAASGGVGLIGLVQDAYLVVLALAIVLAVRFGGRQGFSTTPLDVLLVITVLAAGALGFRDPGSSDTAALLLRLVVLFYGCELTVSGAGKHTRASEWSLVSVALVLLVKIFAIT